LNRQDEKPGGGAALAWTDVYFLAVGGDGYRNLFSCGDIEVAREGLQTAV